MPAVLLLTGLLLLPLHQAGAQAPPPQLPDRPGVFAITNRGVVELTTFGERNRVETAIDSFSFSQSALDQIPVVASVRSFYVNMLGWVPKDLYLIAGRKRLGTPRDDYRRLNGRAYNRGPILFEILTEALEPPALEQQYRNLTRKKRAGEDVRAFVVLEVNNDSGLNRRSYPIEVEIPPASVAK